MIANSLDELCVPIIYQLNFLRHREHSNFPMFFYNRFDIWRIACLVNRVINYDNSYLNELITNRLILHIFQKLKTAYFGLKKQYIE